MEFYILIGGLGFVAIALLLIIWLTGDKAEAELERDILKKERDEARRAKQIAEQNDKLSGDELRKRAARWVRPNKR